MEPGSHIYRFIHADHLNTPRAITNSTGQLVWTWANDDPFGANVPNENPSSLGNFTCNLRLPGQYFDKETNNHYNYFRDYDPAIGRYVQSDPIGLRGGVNTYLYAGGNPIRFSDPRGLDYAGMYSMMNSPSPSTVCGSQQSIAKMWNSLSDYIVSGEARDDLADIWSFLNTPTSGCAKYGCITGMPPAAGIPIARVQLLEQVTDATLRNRIIHMYRPNAKVGSGSSADALRAEGQTGILLSPSGHGQKVLEMRNGLVQDLRSGRLNSTDTRIALELLKDVQNALRHW